MNIEPKRDSRSVYITFWTGSWVWYLENVNKIKVIQLVLSTGSLSNNKIVEINSVKRV